MFRCPLLTVCYYYGKEHEMEKLYEFRVTRVNERDFSDLAEQLQFMCGF